MKRGVAADRRASDRLEDSVSARYGGMKYTPPHVLTVLGAAGGRREHEVVGPRAERAAPMGEQLVAQHSSHVDGARAGCGLCGADVKAAARQVDVAPAQRDQFADPKAAKSENREGRPATHVRAITARDVVKFTCGPEQCGDLLRLQETAVGSGGLGASPATARGVA
ncbi:MAG TPA: hypothetical protein VHX66_17515 [Solirubrobacteraceae bacterium]|nr:hypothetical protein [Solirubrobacteraceae bacterium]